MKRCTRCGLVKPSTNFRPEARHKDGLDSACRQCMYERSKIWRAVNPDQCRSRAKDRYKKCRQKIREQRSATYQKHKIANRERQRLYYLANRESCLAATTAWIQANPQKRRDSRSAWAKTNARWVQQYNASYVANAPDHYVATLLRRNCKTMRINDVPQPLIAAKRAHLKVQRLIKEKQK